MLICYCNSALNPNSMGPELNCISEKFLMTLSVDVWNGRVRVIFLRSSLICVDMAVTTDSEILPEKTTNFNGGYRWKSCFTRSCGW